MKKKIILNKSLADYAKVHRNPKCALLSYTKKEVEDFDNAHKNATKNSGEKDYLLKNHKWWLIGDTYYQVPRPLTRKWFRNLNKGWKVGLPFLTVTVIAGIAVVTVGLIMDNTGITYTLDSDIKIKKIDNDIVIDNDSKLPGITIKHSNKDKTAKGEFKVQAFTDLHLDHKQECCNYTFSMLARNIMAEKPDLVVFCGDNVTSSFNKPRTKQFAQLLEDLGVYWAATLGNHEKTPATPNDGGNPMSISRDRMLNIWASYPHCLNKNIKYTNNDGSKVDGVGNCVVNLKSENGVTQSLFFLDSNTLMSVDQCKHYETQLKEFVTMGKTTLKAGQTVYNKDYYDYVKDSQVKWYSDTFKTIKDANIGNEPHSTVFSHHPLYEMEKAYVDDFNALSEKAIYGGQGVGGNDKIRAFTIYDQNKAKSVTDLHDLNNGFVKNVTYQVDGINVPEAHMIRREDMCYSPHDLAYKNNGGTPLFKAIKDAGNNNAFFCGHDHQNNFVLKHQNVFMGYIQPGCYSSNNLYTKGMLGDDPFVEELKYENGDHLIQGYSVLTYSDNKGQQTKNVLTDFVQKENYYLHPAKKTRERIIGYIAKTRSSAYSNKRSDYLDKLS